MAGDLNKPSVADQYTALLQYIRDNFGDLITALEFGSPANLPVGAKRINPTSKAHERWNGSAWVEWHPYQTRDASSNILVGGAIQVKSSAYRVEQVGTVLQMRSGVSSVVIGNSVYLASNAELAADGTTWNRLNTGNPASLISAAQSGPEIYTAASGANPISWSGPYKIKHGYRGFVGAMYVTPLANTYTTAMTVNYAITDTDSMYNAGTPNRVTIPSGVSRVRCIASAEFPTHATGERHMTLYRNGSSLLTSLGSVVARDRQAGLGSNGVMCNFTSPAIPVVVGDYLEVKLYQSSGVSMNITTAFFEVEILA